MSIPSGHVNPAVLDQYIQAGLPESEALSLQGHLEICFECRSRKELLEFLIEMASRNRNLVP